MYSPKLYRQDGVKTEPRFETTIFDGIMWVTTCMTLSPDILQYIYHGNEMFLFSNREYIYTSSTFSIASN